MPTTTEHRGRLLRRGRSSLPGHYYHVTTTTAQRAPLFLDFYAASAVARCFDSAALQGDAMTMAWVVMPDHAHWLLRLGERDSLASVVNRIKSSSARESNRASGRTGPVWARGYFDRVVRTDDDLTTVASYLVANPVRAGLVSTIAAYPFWNTAWLD